MRNVPYEYMNIFSPSAFFCAPLNICVVNPQKKIPNKETFHYLCIIGNPAAMKKKFWY